MIKSEKQLPSKNGEFWTEELQCIASNIRYYRLVLRKLNGVHIGDNILDNTRRIAQIETKTNDVNEIHAILRKLWTKLRQYHKD